jgi:hypothetical protein
MPTMKKYLRLLRRLPAVLSGRDAFFRPTAGCRGHVERFGAGYGAWSIVTDKIGPDSVVYSFGVGEDVSFDLDLMNRYGLCVHIFDPTPKSIEWVRSQHFSDQVLFHEYGLAAVDGEISFNPPENPAHVSFTVLSRPSTRDQAVSLPVKRLQTIMNDLGHR